MQAGNVSYNRVGDLPLSVPLFPLAGALLLPGCNMPLNVFEPRYLAMVETVLKGDRLIGIVQPRFDPAGAGAGTGDAETAEDGDEEDAPALCEVGCLGRLTAFQESGDGRILVNLAGVARFRLQEEIAGRDGYRMARIGVFGDDLADQTEAAKAVDRQGLLTAFRQFLEANEMEADWDGVRQASTESLVNTLSMMSPYGPAEKQALLEAPDLRTRSETLVAITEIALAREAPGEDSPSLQ